MEVDNIRSEMRMDVRSRHGYYKLVNNNTTFYHMPYDVEQVLMQNIRMNEILLNIVENVMGTKPLRVDAPEWHPQATAYASGNEKNEEDVNVNGEKCGKGESIDENDERKLKENDCNENRCKSYERCYEQNHVNDTDNEKIDNDNSKTWLKPKKYVKKGFRCAEDNGSCNTFDILEDE